MTRPTDSQNNTRWCSRAFSKTRPTQHPIPTTQVVNCLTTTRIEECFT
jgi:hypothetical protein